VSSKAAAKTLGGVPAGLVGEVLLGRLDVGVTHPLHDLAGIGGADRVGAECVAEVVEAKVAELGRLECLLVASAEGLVAEVTAELVAEDEIAVGGVMVALAEAGERGSHAVHHRDGAIAAALGRALAAVGPVAADADRGGVEVDVLPAEPEAARRGAGR
jgi:hypothetical protein